MMTSINSSTPEAMGIPSVSLSNFINRLSDYKIPMHSLLIARHGHLLLEGYYAPYQSDTLHRMFSVTKSFTSIAISLLVNAGHITLDDPIIHFFPEYTPPKVHPFLAEVTIKDMLSMQTCYSSTTYKNTMDSNWVESFFTTKPSHRPGRSFNYDTSASHTLCALVEKLTGQPLLDYLREHCLDQIGFSQDAYVIKDPFGSSMGGSGLMATPMDLMLFAQLMMNKGNYNGLQLVPKNYIEDATRLQSNTEINGPTIEEKQGYGYQFWCIQHDGFACYGMGGQLAICLPEHDLIVVTTADTQGLSGGNQLIYNSLYEEVLPTLSDKPVPIDYEDSKMLNQLIQNLSIQPLSPVKAPFANPVLDSKILWNKPYICLPNDVGFTSLELTFDPRKKEGQLTIFINDVCYNLPFGFGHLVIDKFPIYNHKCATSATWHTPNTLYIKSHLIDESIGSIHFHLTFKEDSLSVYMKKIEETYYTEFSAYLEGHLRL